METTLLIIALIYCMVNAFMAGLIYEVKSMPTVLLTLFFGMLIGIGFYLMAGCKALWWIFTDNTGLSFWYHFNYTDLYRNLKPDELERINALANKRHFGSRRSTRIVHKYVRKINERHGYSYNHVI